MLTVFQSPRHFAEEPVSSAGRLAENIVRAPGSIAVMASDIIGSARQQPIIGVVHLLPLPGSPRYAGRPSDILDHALADAGTLVQGGVDAILIENFGDTPYFPERVPRETIAWMTRVAGLVHDRYRVPLGVCVLRNDGRAALAIAHSVDAQFIRVCILASPRVTDQGLLQGNAYKLLRDRARLGAKVTILADVDIKHSYPLAPSYSIKADAADLVARSHADALIITGTATGRPIAESDLSDLRAITDAPILVGSGVTEKNIRQLANGAGGFIIGTAFKDTQHPEGRVILDKVRAIVSQLHG